MKAIFSKPNQINKTTKFKKKRGQKKQHRQETRKRVKRARAKRAQEEKTSQSSHHKPVDSPNKPKATKEIRLPVSRKAKEVFRRTGNLPKALAVDRKLAKSCRSRRRKGHDQKVISASKKPNSRPDTVRDGWDVDDVDPYELCPREWDEESWYIEELWGNGQAGKWNMRNYVRCGLPCPHVHVRPPIVYHHRSYDDYRYIIPYGDKVDEVINIYWAVY